MSKPASITILYPRKDGATFNLDYYLSTHMPLVTEHWKSYGLRSWKVTQYNEESSFSVGCVLEFESTEHFKKAAGGVEAATIFGDVPKFSTEKPLILAGELVGSE